MLLHSSDDSDVAATQGLIVGCVAPAITQRGIRACSKEELGDSDLAIAASDVERRATVIITEARVCAICEELLYRGHIAYRGSGAEGELQHRLIRGAGWRGGRCCTSSCGSCSSGSIYRHCSEDGTVGYDRGTWAAQAEHKLQFITFSGSLGGACTAAASAPTSAAAAHPAALDIERDSLSRQGCESGRTIRGRQLLLLLLQ